MGEAQGTLSQITGYSGETLAIGPNRQGRTWNPAKTTRRESRSSQSKVAFSSQTSSLLAYEAPLISIEEE